jgi:hypothetical protein
MGSRCKPGRRNDRLSLSGWTWKPEQHRLAPQHRTESSLTLAGQTSVFNGTMSAVNGYTSSVTLSCTAGATAAPSTCGPSPVSFTPANKTPFTVSVGGAAGDYSFNLKSVGGDSNHLTHTIPLTLHLLNFGMTTPSPGSVAVSRGTASSPVSFHVTAAGSFSQSVTVSCTTSIPSATCNLTPGATVNPKAGSPVNMTASVAVPVSTIAGAYSVTLQASTSGAPAPLTTSFNLVVTANPDFVISEPSAFPEINAGSAGTTGTISIASRDGFSGTVTLACPATFGAGSCSISRVLSAPILRPRLSPLRAPTSPPVRIRFDQWNLGIYRAQASRRLHCWRLLHLRHTDGVGYTWGAGNSQPAVNLLFLLRRKNQRDLRCQFTPGSHVHAQPGESTHSGERRHDESHRNHQCSKQCEREPVQHQH